MWCNLLERNRSATNHDLKLKLERFSTEFSKTKTKLIPLANHKCHRQSSEFGRTSVSEPQSVFVLLLLGREKVTKWPEFFI